MQLSVSNTLILAIIQGLTEFLPVSSSGHLVLAEWIMGVRGSDVYGGVTFEVAVHVGTMGAVVVVYRERVINILRSCFFFVLSGFRITERNRGGVVYLIFILLGTIPAVLAGLFLYDSIVRSFDSPLMTSVCLFATGIFLLFSRGRGRNKDSQYDSIDPGDDRRVNPDHSMVELPIEGQVTILRTASIVVLIGIAQAIAIMPGCSRSGWTITTALLLGLSFRKSAEFSFLLSLPAIFGALLLEIIKNTGSFADGDFQILVVGILTSFVSGWFAIRILLAVLKRGGLHKFSYYLIPVGVVAFLLLKFGA